MLDESRKPVKSPAYQLIVANALWGQQGYPFQPAFVDLVKKNYGAGLNQVDYRQAEQARNTINDWVAGQTKDKIQELIAKGMLDADTRLVLTNAIYFKSNWEEKFSKDATKNAPFHVTADRSVEAPMMHQQIEVPMMHQQDEFGYMENDTLQALELPYRGHALSMVVLLPKQADGLADLEKNLTADHLRQWTKDLPGDLVQVTLPKFNFSGEFELAKTLKAMGMTDAFDGNADFSGMTTAERLFISHVIHKAFVALDEEGTEAAAATAVIMATSAAAPGRPSEPKIFKADHPFIFLIRHNPTGEILFLGRMVNPKAE